jgi:hypothetical protein
MPRFRKPPFKFRWRWLALFLIPLFGTIAWFYYDYRSSAKYVHGQLADEYGLRNFYLERDYLHDSVELEPGYKAVCAEVDAKVDQAIKLKFGDKSFMGKAYAAGQIKKQILEKEYGIHWRSIEEMNPWIKFD